MQPSVQMYLSVSGVDSKLGRCTRVRPIGLICRRRPSRLARDLSPATKR